MEKIRKNNSEEWEEKGQDVLNNNEGSVKDEMQESESFYREKIIEAETAFQKGAEEALRSMGETEADNKIGELKLERDRLILLYQDNIQKTRLNIEEGRLAESKKKNK